MNLEESQWSWFSRGLRVRPNMDVCLFRLLLPQVQTNSYLTINDHHLPQDWTTTGRYVWMASGHSTSSTTRPRTAMHGGSPCIVIKNRVQATGYPWLVLVYRRHSTSGKHPLLASFSAASSIYDP